MKVDRFVCDNHADREAVVTYSVEQLPVGSRRNILPESGDVVVLRHVDLCAECAAVVGVIDGFAPASVPEPEDDGELSNDAQRRLIFARCREIGLDEDERHALLERVTGDSSITNLLSKDVDRVVTELAAVEAARAA